MDSLPSLAPPSYQDVVLSDLSKADTVNVSEPAAASESAPGPRVDYGEDPLVTACRNNDQDFLTNSQQLARRVDYLFSNKNKGSKLEESISLMHVACIENKPQVVKLLLERDADPNIKLPKSGLTPIELVCTNKKVHPELVQLLASYLFPHRLEVNASHSVTAADYPNDFTLLQLACRSQNVQAIKTLLSNHADPNQVAQGWNTPPLHLVCAAKTVDSETVSSLLEAKADVDVRYKGLTPLHILCKRKTCDVEALRALLAGKADINAVTQEAVTPLMLAIQNNAQLADLLLTYDGININKADHCGRQAIHYAAQFGHEALINVLMDKGADVNAKTNQGVTPLHLAILEKNEPAIYALLEHGADTSIKAPVTAYSRARARCITLCACFTVIFPLWLFFPAASGHCDDFWFTERPIYERHVRRYGQTYCPDYCGLSPMEMADESLQEQLASRIVTSQPEGSSKTS